MHARSESKSGWGDLPEFDVPFPFSSISALDQRVPQSQLRRPPFVAARQRIVAEDLAPCSSQTTVSVNDNGGDESVTVRSFYRACVDAVPTTSRSVKIIEVPNEVTRLGQIECASCRS